jgi:putative addiction module component (TIGR02574 family)
MLASWHDKDCAEAVRGSDAARPEERAALAGLLIESLEPESEEGVEEAWMVEVERRMAELDSGAVQAIPWDEVKARLYGSSRGPGRR